MTEVGEGASRRVLVHCHSGCTQDDVIAALRDMGLWPRARRAPIEELGDSEELLEPIGTARNVVDATQPKHAPVVRRYPIAGPTSQDAEYKLRAYHVRTERLEGGKVKKRFSWEVVNEDGTTSPGLGDLRVEDLPLYIPDSHPFAMDALLVVEGEKSADAIVRAWGGARRILKTLREWPHVRQGPEAIFGVAATVTGASGAPSIEVLRRYRERVMQGVAVLWPDNDKPGREHMRKVAANLQAAGFQVFEVQPEWLGLNTKEDAADYFERHGGNRSGVEHAIWRALKQPPLPLLSPEDAPKLASNESAATKLLRVVEKHLASGEAGLWRTPDGEVYLRLPDPWGPSVPVDSETVALWLDEIYAEEYLDAMPGETAIRQVQRRLKARGMRSKDVGEPAVRVEQAADGRIFVDLGQTNGLLEVGPGGVLPAFSREEGLHLVRARAGELPLAEWDVLERVDADLDALWEFVHVDPEDRPIVLAWLLNALFAGHKQAIMLLTGPQGVGKTTIARILASLVDPNRAAVMLPPENVRDLATQARTRWVLAYDNVSYVPGWWSDALCALATGAGQVTRKLYTDADASVIAFTRPVILTTIADVLGRPDLEDRSIIVEIHHPERRRADYEIERAWERKRAGVLKGLLQLAAQVMAALDEVEVPPDARLADYARVGIAAFGDAFARRYLANREVARATRADEDPFVRAVVDVVDLAGGRWVGRSAALRDQLREVGHDDPKLTPSTTSRKLRRVVPLLDSKGVRVTFDRTSRARLIELVRVADPDGDEPPVPPSGPGSEGSPRTPESDTRSPADAPCADGAALDGPGSQGGDSTSESRAVGALEAATVRFRRREPFAVLRQRATSARPVVHSNGRVVVRLGGGAAAAWERVGEQRREDSARRRRRVVQLATAATRIAQAASRARGGPEVQEAVRAAAQSVGERLRWLLARKHVGAHDVGQAEALFEQLRSYAEQHGIDKRVRQQVARRMRKRE